jgi:GNAT superfamily N-acetyltransferase
MKLEIATLQIGSLEIDSIKKLFNACRWDWLEPDSEMLFAFQHSFRVFGATVDGKLVGFGRVLSDGKIYGLLVDLMVDPAFRSRGVGRQLTNFIVEQCASDGVKIIQLLSSAEGKDLYLKSGFTPCPTESPGMMKFIGGKSD